jgi:hypothetical protein
MCGGSTCDLRRGKGLGKPGEVWMRHKRTFWWCDVQSFVWNLFASIVGLFEGVTGLESLSSSD